MISLFPSLNLIILAARSFTAQAQTITAIIEKENFTRQGEKRNDFKSSMAKHPRFIINERNDTDFLLFFLGGLYRILPTCRIISSERVLMMIIQRLHVPSHSCVHVMSHDFMQVL